MLSRLVLLLALVALLPGCPNGTTWEPSAYPENPSGIVGPAAP